MIYKLHHQANRPFSQKFDSFVRDMKQESGKKKKKSTSSCEISRDNKIPTLPIRIIYTSYLLYYT